MHAHIVLAHPEARSFNGHLADVARRALVHSPFVPHTQHLELE